MLSDSCRGSELCACSSRKGTEETASFLLSTGGSHNFMGSAAQRAALINAASQLENKHLCQAVQGGIAFHHGNLSANDRAIVETLFLERAIEVRLTSLEPMHNTAPHPSFCCPILLSSRPKGLPMKINSHVPLREAM